MSMKKLAVILLGVVLALGMVGCEDDCYDHHCHHDCCDSYYYPCYNAYCYYPDCYYYDQYIGYCYTYQPYVYECHYHPCN